MTGWASERSAQRRAEGVLDGNYRRLEGEVIRSVGGRLGARMISLDRVDIEEAYNQAWNGVYQLMARGQSVENLAGLLVDVTYKRSLDAFRQRREAHYAEVDLEGHVVEVDLASEVDDQQKIHGLVARLKGRLNDNERRAVTLCVLHGYTRPEAAKMLGFKEAAFQKIMDGATKKIAMIVAGMEARGCGDEEWASALRAFALGVISESDRDYRRVAAHISEALPGSSERGRAGVPSARAVACTSSVHREPSRVHAAYIQAANRLQESPESQYLTQVDMVAPI